MHAIASAIAGIHRTSAAPTGSRTLRHLVLHRASSAAAAQAVGRPDQWGSPPAQPRAYAVAGSHRRRASSAAAAYAVGRPDQLRVSQLSRGSTRWRARNQQPQTSPSRSVKCWPLLPWSVGAAAGYVVDPPGNGHAQGRQLHRGITRGGPNALGLAPLEHYGSFCQAMASTPPGWPAQLRDAVVHPGTLNAGPPVQPRAYAAAASSTEWPAPPQAMRGHSDRQQVDGAAADSSGPPGAPQTEAPVRVIPGAGAGPGCEATRPGTARAAGTKRLWQVGGAGPAGLGSRSSGNLLAVLTGRAQQVSFSPSRTPRAGPAHVIQQPLRKVAPSGGRPPADWREMLTPLTGLRDTN